MAPTEWGGDKIPLAVESEKLLSLWPCGAGLAVGLAFALFAFAFASALAFGFPRIVCTPYATFYFHI